MALRSFAICGALFILFSAAAAQPPSSSEPNTADGKPITQIGLNGIAYWIYEDQFINLLKQSDYSWAAARKWPDATAMKFEEMYAAGLIDKETMVPTAIPQGFDFLKSGLYRAGARYWPQYYAGTYVFDWEGEAAARCGFSQPTRKIGANRIECDFPPTAKDWSNIEITRIGAGFKNPRLYRKENEAAINRGDIFDPKWVAMIGRYKIIRTMDIQNANNSWMRSVDELMSKKSLAWGTNDSYNASAAALGIRRGMPIEVLFDMAMAGDAALWMTVPGILGAPPVFIDEVDQLKTWQVGQPWIRARAKENAREIVNSPEWRKYADEVVRSMIASGYPENRTLYIELWNEVWNTANPWWKMTYYNSGLAEGIGGQEGLPYRYGYGYMTAMFAVTFEAALKAQGRETQSWISVLAGQNANPATTADALKGFKRYFKDKGLDPAPYLKRLGVSTQSYFGDAFSVETGLIKALDDADRLAKWTAAIEADPEGLKKRLTDHILSTPATVQGSLPWVVRQRALHQSLAEKSGAFFLGDYEGGDHNTVPGLLAKDSRFLGWFREWREGPEGERLLKAWADALLAQNPEAVVSDYHSIGDFQPGKPWVEAAPGEENGRTRGLAPYLRRAPHNP